MGVVSNGEGLGEGEKGWGESVAVLDYQSFFIKFGGIL